MLLTLLIEFNYLDLHELIDLVEDPSLEPSFSTKILVLHRQPFDTVKSNFRRGFLNNKRCLKEQIRGKRIRWKNTDEQRGCDALLYLAREAETQLTFFSAELGSLSAAFFRTIDFKKLIHGKKKLLIF